MQRFGFNKGDKKYGYEVGEIVVLTVPVWDNGGTPYPAGTELEITCIPEKLRWSDEWKGSKNRTPRQRFHYVAMKADRRDKINGYVIREDFATIKKLQKSDK